MIDSKLRSEIAALLILSDVVSPLPWLNDENPFSSGPDMDGSEEDIRYAFLSANLASRLAQIVLQQDKELEYARNAMAILSASGYVDNFEQPEESMEVLLWRLKQPIQPQKLEDQNG